MLRKKHNTTKDIRKLAKKNKEYCGPNKDWFILQK